MSIERRTFLKTSAALARGVFPGGPFQGFVAGEAVADAMGDTPFRTLRAIPDQRDGTVRLHLQEGLAYRSFHDTEFPVVLGDGTNLPGRHDGMGAFRRRNRNGAPGSATSSPALPSARTGTRCSSTPRRVAA